MVRESVKTKLTESMKIYLRHIEEVEEAGIAPRNIHDDLFVFLGCLLIELYIYIYMTCFFSHGYRCVFQNKKTDQIKIVRVSLPFPLLSFPFVSFGLWGL
jgi:hypothetical protein